MCRNHRRPCPAGPRAMSQKNNGGTDPFIMNWNKPRRSAPQPLLPKPANPAKQKRKPAEKGLATKDESFRGFPKQTKPMRPEYKFYFFAIVVFLFLFVALFISGIIRHSGAFFFIFAMIILIRNKHRLKSFFEKQQLPKQIEISVEDDESLSSFSDAQLARFYHFNRKKIDDEVFDALSQELIIRDLTDQETLTRPESIFFAHGQASMPGLMTQGMVAQAHLSHKFIFIEAMEGYPDDNVIRLSSITSAKVIRKSPVLAIYALSIKYEQDDKERAVEIIPNLMSRWIGTLEATGMSIVDIRK